MGGGTQDFRTFVVRRIKKKKTKKYLLDSDVYLQLKFSEKKKNRFLKKKFIETFGKGWVFEKRILRPYYEALESLQVKNNLQVVNDPFNKKKCALYKTKSFFKDKSGGNI